MACFHPLPAWRNKEGEITLNKAPPDTYKLDLPCGNCLGCRMAKARAWALRCHIEQQRHETTVFTTLTYNEQHVPITLERRHAQLWLKQLRRHKPAKSVRYFYCGEYGEQTKRPHFHAILYGCGTEDSELVQDTWGRGNTLTENITPARIAYVAGYCSKKINYRLQEEWRTDPETGEYYKWQPPYRDMSRRPGIGGHARQWPESWRLYAVHNNHKQAVPRFYHEAWKQQASQLEKEDLEWEKIKMSILRGTQTKQQLEAQEINAQAKQRQQGEKRGL